MALYKVKKLGLRLGKHPISVMKFNRARYSREDIERTANKLSKEWAEMGERGVMFVSLLYPEGWRGGSQTEFGQKVRLYRYADSNNDEPDPDYYPRFEIYVCRFSKGRIGGNSENNDCLFDCLSQLIPKFFNRPEKLKKFLGLKRNEKVPIEALEKIEQQFPNCNIHVSGDHTYESKNKGKYDAYLRLYDEHYSLDWSKVWKLPGVADHERKPLVFKLSQMDSERCLVFDGKKVGTVPRDFIREIRRYPLYDPRTKQPQEWVLVRCDDKLTLRETYRKFIEEADLLKVATNGVINLYKTGSITKSAMKFFHQLNPNVQPEELKPDEQQWIKKATAHSLLWADQYEGEAYYYDVVSMYPTILRYLSFGVPIKRGTFKKLTQKEFDELKFFEYGIYRCTIENSNKKLFLENPDNYYTHFDLTTAKELGYKITIIDEETNCLLYPGETRVEGKQLFAKYTDFLFPFKKSGVKLLEDLAKKLLNCLWGKLCQVNKIKIYYDLEKNEDCEIGEDKSLTDVCRDGRYLIIQFAPNERYYETSFARLAPFLLARGRRMISKIMQPHLDNIVRVHTDGFLSKVPLKFKKQSQSLDSVKIGSNFGDLSAKYHPHLIVHNAIRITNKRFNKIEKKEWIKLN